MKAFLNVGGGSKDLPVPKRYESWRHDLLDIDPRGKPDIRLDARQLPTLAAGTYDAVYCAHNLEHYHRHDAGKVVRGFHHVLKPAGFAEIIVPNLEAVMQKVVRDKLDIDDLLYVAPAGPILVRDVIYGYHVEIERNGNDFYGHKTGFTLKALTRFMADNGFPLCAAGTYTQFSMGGFFFKQEPTAELMQSLGLKSSSG